MATTRPSTPPPRTLAEALVRFEIDPRLTLCHVWETRDGAIAGFVEHEQHRALLAHWLGKDVSRVKLLPEQSRTSHRFGIVTLQQVVLRDGPMDEPGHRDNVTELLFGEPVWVMDENASGGAFLVRGRDGYLGWVDAGAFWPVSSSVFVKMIQQDDRAGAALGAGGAETEVARLITRRDAVGLERHLQGKRVGEVGRSRVEMILGALKSYLGTPYVWGGRSRAGIDCSGLVQVNFARHGIVLPRDADQQSNVGRLVATRWMKEALLPGDLLFFLSSRRGNVSHVAVYLGDGQYIEAAGKDVRISKLAPAVGERVSETDGETEGEAPADAAGEPVSQDASRTGRGGTGFAWARRVIE
jgi:NlpC/P60 family/Bacterial dipeptidyl-peptidase Sh3 domain